MSHNENVPINRRGSGPNGCFVKDDILELWGTKSIPVLTNLPVPCEYIEIIHDETNKTTFSVSFLLDTKSIRCSFPGCSFSHDISKVYSRSIINHLHLRLHAISHRSKDNTKDDRLKRKKQSLLNNFFQKESKKKCMTNDDILEMNDDIITQTKEQTTMNDDVIIQTKDQLRGTMVRPY